MVLIKLKVPAPVLLVIALLASGLAGLCLCQSSRSDQAEELAADLKALESAGVGTDESGLLEFFKKQTVSDAQRRKIGELIKQLGDECFRVREAATRELKAMGAAALPALQQATQHEDPEVAIRAKRCGEDIENGRRTDTELLARAARVLSTHNSSKAVEVLLSFLPDAADSGVEDEIIRALTALTRSGDKAHPPLVQALTDKSPLRRVAAGEALANLPEHDEAVRRLIQDAEPLVRLRVSLVLVCSGDRRVVPQLIDIVPQLTRDQVWQVEDVLYRLSDGKVLPLLISGDEAARKVYRDGCLAWWKEHGAKADLAVLRSGPRRKATLQVRASQTWANPAGVSHAPYKAIDGNRHTSWYAGEHAPPDGTGIWIEVDAMTVRQLGGLYLVTAQSPNGPTAHEIWVSAEPIGDDRTKAKLVHTFKGLTHEGDLLHLEFPNHLSGRYVQIRTTASPSWVAWTEIELGVR
jgi:Spy/CpxP family protein refolding chaperone